MGTGYIRMPGERRPGDPCDKCAKLRASCDQLEAQVKELKELCDALRAERDECLEKLANQSCELVSRPRKKVSKKKTSNRGQQEKKDG